MVFFDGETRRACLRVFFAGPGDGLRLGAAFAARVLPDENVEEVDNVREEVVRRGPCGLRAVHGDSDRRVGGELGDENAQPPPCEFAGEQACEGDLVVALEVGLDRPRVLG